MIILFLILKSFSIVLWTIIKILFKTAIFLVSLPIRLFRWLGEK